VERAEKAHKILLLENETNTFADTIARTLKLFDEIQSPAFKLNLDPGNFYSIREDTTPDAYEIFYEKGLVAHMHVKDPKFHLPFVGSYFHVVGMGKIDYVALFKQAKKHDYTGLFSLETHCPGNREKISIESLDYLHKILPNTN
jgi:sugar phosphate isomerase/epimerase